MAEYNSDRTGANIDATLDKVDGTSPNTTIDIDGGTIDGTPIGQNAKSTGEFTDISLGNNEKINFGSSDELQIYHNGSSYIKESGTGSLKILGQSLFLMKEDETKYVTCSGSTGQVFINYGGATKLKTTSTGVDVTGDISLNDNGKVKFGAGDDLQIYHSGTHSYISDQGTGNLNILASSTINLLNSDSSDYMARFNDNGSVQLYHDGSAKLATTSTGVDVTGTVTADGLVVEGSIYSKHPNTTTTFKVDNFGSSGTDAGALLRLYDSDNNENIVLDARQGSGRNSYMKFGNSFYMSTAGNKRLNIANNGDVQFFENTGTTPKMVWDASAESLGIGTSSPDAKLEIAHTDSTAYSSSSLQGGVGGVLINSALNNNNNISQVTFRQRNNSAYDASIGASGGSGNFLFFKTNNAERMRLDSSGNLLVGTTDDVVWNNSANSTADNGHNLRSDGRAGFSYYNATAGANAAVNVNRTGSDGDLVRLFKNGATVGSIGSYIGDMVTGTGDTGIRWEDGNDSLTPWNASTNTSRGSAISLGASTVPFKDLYLSGSVITGGGSTNNTGVIEFKADSTRAKIEGGYQSGGGGYLKFNTDSAGGSDLERMRIDSSGNLLVGTTIAEVYNGTTTGVALTKSGYIFAGKSGDASLYLNRISNDGALISLGREGTSVGSIGANSGQPYFARTNAGLIVRSSDIVPCNSTGATVDATVDLGDSAARFKDLYLSGGVYLGGTGAANKLDDYEEGTWTPIPQGKTTAGTYSVNELRANYTKIGDTVYLSCTIAASNFTGVGDFQIAGLPFTASLTSVGLGSVQCNNPPWATVGVDEQHICIKTIENSNILEIRTTSRINGANYTKLQCLGSTTAIGYMRINLTYKTN